MKNEICCVLFYKNLSLVSAHKTPRQEMNTCRLFHRDLLFQVEDGNSVSNRTDHGVSIFGEIQISLTVNSSEQVGKLQRGDEMRRERECECLVQL